MAMVGLKFKWLSMAQKTPEKLGSVSDSGAGANGGFFESIRRKRP
jgi:hypothetical protein